MAEKIVLPEDPVWISVWTDDVSKAAVRWSHEKSKRCGRTALQFVRHWVGKTLLNKQG